jgi:cytochrome b6-f complex iron-sulfur subunit
MPSPSRREFLNGLLAVFGLASAGAVLYPVLSFLRPPPSGEANASSVRAATTDEIPPESGKVFRFGSKPGILVRTASGEYRAFSATCTHLDCIVQYRSDLGQIWCACHNGRYDLDGRNVAGPPPRPLEKFRVVIQGKEIIVSREGSSS